MTGLDRVLLTSAAVLCPLAEDLAGFADALLAGRRGAAPLTGFGLADWTARHLPDDPDAAARLRKVVWRAATPAQTAACVAVEAVTRSGAKLGDRSGLIVAGGNLALAHQARTALDFDAKPGGLRASYALTHMDVDVVGAVSELTGIRGEGWVLGGGSASGTLAVVQAARMLAAGWLDHCLVVAPLAELSAAEIEAFRRTGAMSPTGECRPFDVARQGFVYGQAAAAVLLERASVADKRGATVLAEIAGYGQCLDAKRGTEPDSAGQVTAMRAALRVAGVEASAVDYVNAHGTGSVLGDETEARSIRTVFGLRPSLRVNSTKPLVGHCLSAAGLIELIATVAQQKAGSCHPNPNLDTPLDPELALVGRSAEAHPIRTALSNSFAFGGINASVLVRAA
ncbi:beta-ketoacyl synthase N-terminal-like domain-containing protein [Kutzneria chonburiensis]|uniref:Beta-ketoacyl synthase N-terminal-like domain-containing protein n=1 Tax=Kutzneria chonburiensis TaxID=1483604 RepID=A0ABV6N6N9_9PSEU|nr:beta-ketoacyl synthase N-terminal-like domain-containing protein [Kutzneria chonburiensis]